MVHVERTCMQCTFCVARALSASLMFIGDQMGSNEMQCLELETETPWPALLDFGAATVDDRKVRVVGHRTASKERLPAAR